MKMIAIFITLIFCSVAFTEVINVPDDYETIQGAIDASEDGDTVLVESGEYVENINFEGKAIAVIGNPDDPSQVIIDGNEDGSVVRFDNEEDENSILTGFALTNGTGSPDYEDNLSGGGIICLDAAPVLSYLKIYSNSAFDGGGIYIDGSAPLLHNIEIYRNDADVGGGIYVRNTNMMIHKVTIYENDSYTSSGGIYTLQNLTLLNCTIYNNTSAEGISGIYCSGEIIVNSCIIWGHEEPKVFCDTGRFKFNDIEGGRDAVGINRDPDWGDGNIDQDPLFLDPNESNYCLNENSPCIDAGDPDLTHDFDGTRADMGSIPFSHGTLVIEGFVLDAGSGEPIENARVTTSFAVTTFTDSLGFWQISPARVFPFNIVASLEDYIDSTLNDIQLELDDTLEILISLRYSELIPSIERITMELETGDSERCNFGIQNDGNGVLDWAVTPKLRGVAGGDPWTLRQSFPVEEIVEDRYNYGILFINDHYYVSGRGDADGDERKIYVLNRAGVLVNEFVQLGASLYGMQNLAWDGELIWGIPNAQESFTVYGFNTDGDSITSFEAPEDRIRSIVWDSDRELFWMTGVMSEIIGCDRNGNLVVTLDDLPFFSYGLAYYPEDPDGYPLYIIHNPRDNVHTALHKINPDENDTMFVAELFIEGDVRHSRPAGIFFTDEFDPLSTVLVSLADDWDGDRIDVWRVKSNSSWMHILPESGLINPGAQEDLILTVDANELCPMFYPGELWFSHNGIGGETSIDVNLVVTPFVSVSDGETKLPTEFSITGVYPNPFNSSVVINYTLPQAQKVTARIYDMSGRLVETLYHGLQTVGNHSVVWNSQSFGSGIYLLRIQTDKEVKVAKLVAVK